MSKLFIILLIVVLNLDINLYIVSRLLNRMKMIPKNMMLRVVNHLSIVSKLKMKKGVFKHYFDTNIDIVSKLMLMNKIMVKLSMQLMLLLYKMLRMVKRMVIVSMQEVINKVLKANLDINLDIVSKLKKEYLLIPIKVLKQNIVQTNTRKALIVNL